MSPFVSKIQCNHHFSPQKSKFNFITEFSPEVWAHVGQTDRFTNLFVQNYSPRVCWRCIHPSGYSDALQCRDVLTVQQSAAAPWGVSSVTCLTSTALTPQWAEAHNIFMMPTQALSGWMCLSEERLWTFLVFLQGPCQRKAPSFFFLKEKYSPLCMKWMHLEQNCSLKSSIYSRSQMQVFKNLKLHRSTQRHQLSNIPCSAMPDFFSDILRRGERESGRQPNSETLLSPYCSL